MKKENQNNCSKNCEVFSRVVGYFRPVQRWHDGKQEEFKDRKEYDEHKSLGREFSAKTVHCDPKKEQLTAFVPAK